MSPRWAPPPLLVLVLCCLLFRPILGFPVGASTAAKRDLIASASGDDLISGSDFLSIFIGASLGPRTSRNRNLDTRNKVGEEPDQSISSFGARTVPRNRNSLISAGEEPSSETAPHFEDLSGSNTPAVDFIALDNGNMDKSPLPDVTTHVINSGEEFRSESTPSSAKSDNSSDNAPDDPLKTSKDFTSTNTNAPTPSSDGISEEKTRTSATEDELNVVTDIVTSREELSPSTEPFNEAEVQDASTLVQTLTKHDKIFERRQLNGLNITSGFKNSSPVPPMPSTDTDDKTTFELQSSPGPTEATKVNANVDPDRSPSPPVQQVISVRVSSSVVQGPSASPYLSRAKTNSIDRGKAKHYQDSLAEASDVPASDEDVQRRIEGDTSSLTTNVPTSTESSSTEVEVPQSQIGSTSLVIEEQPAATAIQRSQLSVEEALPSSSEFTTRHQTPIDFLQKTVATVVETSRNAQRTPVSYQTSVSSATSDSRVRFYSEPRGYRRRTSSPPETVHTSVVTSHTGSMHANYEQVSGEPIGNGGDGSIESRMGRYGEPHREVRISGPSDSRRNFIPKSQHQIHTDVLREQKSIPVRHQEPEERNYEIPENNYGHVEHAYGMPEQNYEVDEAVSVMTNGRAHGIQTTTQSSADTVIEGQQGKDPNHKFAYVMEGRNYRKYQVQERTSDGFIVGEYGVLSHDDGTLRGVRYTADGTINPRLIQEALVKFLSL